MSEKHRLRHLISLAAGGLLVLAASGVSTAADLVAEEPMSPMVEDVPFTWSGFYIGVSGGYLDPQLETSTPATLFAPGVGFEYGDDGYLIGGTVGYNMQFGSVVAGIEGDLSYAEIEGNYGDLFGFGPDFGGDVEGDYFATVRGRLGYAFDRVMVYGTGGIAFAGLDVRTPLGDIEDDKTGYTVGGGAEYAFTDNISTKVEYLYSDFGDHTEEFEAADITTEFDMHVIRVGLNYKF